jgi:hypothetical protein
LWDGGARELVAGPRWRASGGDRYEVDARWKSHFGLDISVVGWYPLSLIYTAQSGFNYSFSRMLGIAGGLIIRR